MADLDQASDAQAGHNPTADGREDRTESESAPKEPEPPTPVYARDLLALFHKHSRPRYTEPIIDRRDYPYGISDVSVERRDGTKDDVPIPVLLKHSSSDKDQPVSMPKDKQLASMTPDELEAILSNTYCHHCVLEVPYRALDHIPPEYPLLILPRPDGQPRNPHALIAKCPDAECSFGRNNKRICLFCVHRICDVDFTD